MKKNKWYEEGLRFECTGCGKCCTGAPGYVWVSLAEMEEMAKNLDLPLKEFQKRFVRRVGQRYSLVESKSTYDCVFLEGKKCRVYEARPKQCRTFPWWPQNLRSEESWSEAAKGCEGIREDAPLVPFGTIEKERKWQESKD